jgi:WD40 repeat protein
MDPYLALIHDDNSIILLFTENYEQIGQLVGHRAHIICSALAKHEPSLLASGSCDLTARVWDVRTETEVAILPHSRAVRQIGFNDAGDRLLTVDDGECEHPDNLVVWCLRTNQQIYSKAMIEDGTCTYFRDGTYTYFRDNSVHHLCMNTDRLHGQPDRLLVFHPESGDLVEDRSFLPPQSGQFWIGPARDVLAVTEIGVDVDTISVWDFSRNIRLMRTSEPKGMSFPLVIFSPDSKKLAVCKDRTAVVFDIDTGNVLLRKENISDAQWCFFCKGVFSTYGTHLALGLTLSGIGKLTIVLDVATGEIIFQSEGTCWPALYVGSAPVILL